PDARARRPSTAARLEESAATIRRASAPEGSALCARAFEDAAAARTIKAAPATPPRTRYSLVMARSFPIIRSGNRRGLGVLRRDERHSPSPARGAVGRVKPKGRTRHL